MAMNHRAVLFQHIFMNELFFDLIRVAIGTQEGLSHTPSQKEWKALYDMAQKQSLVGVCFAALQRLLAWMGMAAKIQ